MKKRERKGGAIRLLIFIIMLAAATAGTRMAAGNVEIRAAASEDAGRSTPGQDAGALNPAAEEKTVSNSGQADVSSAAAAGEEMQAQNEAGEEAPSVGTDTADDSSTDFSGQDATAAAADEDPAYNHLATELEKGREYMLSLEERTPVEMEYMIAEARKEREKEIAREEYSKKREAYRDTLKDDKLWDSFKDYVFLGDSRVVGYDVFGYLPSDRVLASAGDTINSISDNMDTIRELSPKYIFISYGINDIGIGYWTTKEDYAPAFADKIHDLQKELPNAQIYVNSIIPAREDAEQTYTIWQGIPDYSEAVRQMCEEEGIPFIDNSSILEEHPDLYASDGVHMQSEFYQYWGENQLLGVFDYENGHLTF